MTGLHDKRKAVESPLVRRPARSKPEAARRTKRAAEVPARRIKRTREPAAPTHRRRPPPPVAGDDSTTISYVLRNRLVVVPCTPPVVSRYEETESMHGYLKKSQKCTNVRTCVRSCMEEPEYAPSRQTPTCAQMGLEHYNSVNQGDEHELVEAVESNAFTFNGIWIHVNFLAKPIGATSLDDDFAPKFFFAELRCDHEGLSCISCVKMDPGVPPKKLGGCGVCPRQIMHPADAGYRNAQAFDDSAATAKETCVFTF